MSTVSSRRTRRQPTPPPPSPKILHFPRSRRTRRKQPKPTASVHTNPLLLHQQYLSQKGKLENLFYQENETPFALLNSNSKMSSVFERRERVEEENEDKELFGEYKNGTCGFEEEKWRFQAEILRAECNFLRMEREFALKKLERNRVKMERTLKSAVQTLVSGRKKIFEGKSVNAVLEEEIGDLAEKLEELQKSSRNKDSEVRNCSNFDKKACVLQRRLEKIGGLSDQSCVKESQELPQSSLSIDASLDIDKHSKISNFLTGKNDSTNNVQVDMLKTKMEGLSKGMLERVEEEYGSMLRSSTANSSVASSASVSKRIDHQFSELSAFSSRQLHQEQILSEEYKCSGRCKAIVRKIVEQVRAETEQWSQMQEMLGQVRGEMEELQASRDFWENRAHNADSEIQSLKLTVEEWKQKAQSFETKANELQLQLQLQLSGLKEELQQSKKDVNPGKNREVAMPVPDLPSASFAKQLQREKLVLSRRFKENHYLEEIDIEENKENTRTKELPPLSLGKQLAKEKRIHRRLKENNRTSDKASKQELLLEGRTKLDSNNNGVLSLRRSPLRDIKNSLSPSAKENSRVAAFPFHSPQNSRTRESFRK